MDTIDLSGFRLCCVDDKKADQAILREKRTELGLTQKQVAQKAGVSFVTYHRFESGERNIRTASFELVCKVLSALGISADSFYKGDHCLSDEIVVKDGKLFFKGSGKSVDGPQ